MGLTAALLWDVNGVLFAIDGAWIAIAAVVVVCGGAVFFALGTVRHRRVEHAVGRRVSIGEMCRLEIAGVRGGDVEEPEARMLGELLYLPVWVMHLAVAASAGAVVWAVWFVPGAAWCDVVAAVAAAFFVIGWAKVSRGLRAAHEKHRAAGTTGA